jgi:lipopolysaccharide/colanic/teichoic acid biosynthesis glycosyltransferase
MSQNDFFNDNILKIQYKDVSTKSVVFATRTTNAYIFLNNQSREKEIAINQVYLTAKQFFDFLFASMLLILLFPLLTLVALSIILIDKQSPFFYQERIGYNNKKFKIYKFKTMKPIINNELKKIINEKEKEGKLFKSKDDPRITKTGKFLRKTSIDELLQLVNVLQGNMSLIGPRPVSNFFFKPLPNDIAKIRSSVKPGLTGLWQVSAREKDEDIFDMIHYDLEYINNFGILQDIKIFLKTFKVLTKGS